MNIIELLKQILSSGMDWFNYYGSIKELKDFCQKSSKTLWQNGIEATIEKGKIWIITDCVDKTLNSRNSNKEMQINGKQKYI